MMSSLSAPILGTDEFSPDANTITFLAYRLWEERGRLMAPLKKTGSEPYVKSNITGHLVQFFSFKTRPTRFYGECNNFVS
jgi:hypothetical protein